jgi:hypothetical protein
MNRFLAITLAAAVAGCVSHSATDVIFDGGLDPTIFYVDGYWTPLDAGAQVITFSLPDYWLKMNLESSDGHLPKPVIGISSVLASE